MIQNISFPQEEILLEGTSYIVFPAIVNSSKIMCRITLEALEDHFQARRRSPLVSFRANRPKIELAAEQLIYFRRFEQDGTVLLGTRDF